MELGRIFAFMELINQFQRIDRQIMRHGEDRLENDAEHSYQLAMAAWYINDSEKLGLDSNLLLRYALVHDLVEVYAGDTFAYTTDVEERTSKASREAEAAERIAREFPEFGSLHETIHEYEKRDSREARFVYALDKLLPVIGIYLDEGRTWHKNGVTLQMIRDYKTSKIAESPEVEPYFRELVAVLEAQPSLFPRKLEGDA
jgi:putative hydrolases of HD superfamily